MIYQSVPASMTDFQLNEHISNLLDVAPRHRKLSDGRWGHAFDLAMQLWEQRHPNTRPPAFVKVGPPPACFYGTVPPIYDGDLE